jgi:uncharacterized protein
MDQLKSTRRRFLHAVPATALASGVLAQTSSAAATGIPNRPLGRTGIRVSMIGLGGAHAGRGEESACIRLIQTAVDEGVTFMDNAWEYNKGRSEELMGKALSMDSRRQKAFLMTKVCSREYKGAMEQIEESLKRLQTDCIDLVQFHECNYHNDPEWIMEKGGLRAAQEAKKQGKIRFIGFTGHKAPEIHLKMLALNVDWDTAQMPNNVMDGGFLSFRHQVMPVCMEKNMGIIGMKGCCGDGRILRDKLVTLEEAYRYCLSQPVSTHVFGITTIEMLQDAVRIARNFTPLSHEEHQALVSRLKDVRGDGRYELFKTSKRYDSGYHRTQHGFETTGV